MLTVVHCYTYVVCCCFFRVVKYVTRIVIVKDAVIGSPPHEILHRSLTNQIAIHLLSCNKFISPFLSLFD